MDKKVLLLSIDGGGVRGKIVATFLALLEQDLGKSIYDTFDFFAGTSTGALIILGITANHYTSDKITELYNVVNLNRIFQKSFWRCLPIHMGASYKGEGKQKFLEEIFADKRYHSIVKPTLISAYDFVNNKAVIFKTSGGSDSAYNPLVSEVANATTAAPTYFPSVLTREVNPRNLIDGGIAANNPSLCLISEALSRGYSLSSLRLLSFGTGYESIKEDSKSSKDWGIMNWLNHGLVDHLMLGDSSMTQYQCNTILGANYLRIDGLLDDVAPALDNIAPDNLQRIEALAHKWYLAYKDAVLEFLAL
jgi:patatin-like phospholipase/acyl hydrolase